VNKNTRNKRTHELGKKLQCPTKTTLSKEENKPTTGRNKLTKRKIRIKISSYRKSSEQNEVGKNTRNKRINTPKIEKSETFSY
jgi:hypothetical protein